MCEDPAADTFTEYMDHLDKQMALSGYTLSPDHLDKTRDEIEAAAEAERKANPLFMWSRQSPRNFALYREHDVSGVSGTGTVAWGTEFPDGMVVMRWCVEGKPSSTVAYDSLSALEEIHLHGGATKIIWYN